MDYKQKTMVEQAVDLLLILLILTGIIFRLTCINWSKGASLHPDEYGLTNTLTALKIPSTLGDYFNTRISTISPYNKYDLQGGLTDHGPDNRMRWGQWPIIIIRSTAELIKETGYNEIRLLGRYLSALADSLALVFIFLIGQRLYNRRTGLLAAALSALAVMQIQQSHFMTADNFGGLFTSITLYAAVRIAQQVVAVRPASSPAEQYTAYHIHPDAWKWYALFGVGLGMALATRINLAPLAGLVLVAAFISISDLKLRRRKDLLHIAGIAALHLFLAGLVTLITFRLTQPMSFRAARGETTLLTLNLNQDWLDSMKVAQAESNGTGGGPPGEQWTDRAALLFPWMNMVIWGMGLPLGLAAWSGFLWSLWRILRYGRGWRAHLIPLIWVGGYFLFMGTRWVKSVRYFLPIYPFLCLLAAWALISLWKKAKQEPLAGEKEKNSPISIQNSPRRFPILPVLLFFLVLGGTFAWAWAFTGAVYRTENTRIQATNWMYENIPAPFRLSLQTEKGERGIPVFASKSLVITHSAPFVQSFTAPEGGSLSKISMAHVVMMAPGTGHSLTFTIALDIEGTRPITRAVMPLDSVQPVKASAELQAAFSPVSVDKGQTYYLIITANDEEPVSTWQTVVFNESWDEGLPVYYDGFAPISQNYRLESMEVRWNDDENKRRMLLDNLNQADYIILPSQRSIWATSRLPLTYPMTMEYYRALFDGRLGFELAAVFQSPWQLGPLNISDAGGALAWNQKPSLPVFNYNLFAAEEAFTVYDHPPVWIFKKRADFNLESAQQILAAVDLSKVVVQSPIDATKYWWKLRWESITKIFRRP